MATITEVVITGFRFEVRDFGLVTAAAGVRNMVYKKASIFRPKRFAMRIETDEGESGHGAEGLVSARRCDFQTVSSDGTTATLPPLRCHSHCSRG